MISITEIASYVPEGFESNLDKFDKFGIGREFIDEKIGVYKVARKDAAQETSDLCVESFRRLEAKTEIDPAQVDCIVVCTQNPDGHGLPLDSSRIPTPLAEGHVERLLLLQPS